MMRGPAGVCAGAGVAEPRRLGLRDDAAVTSASCAPRALGWRAIASDGGGAARVDGRRAAAAAVTEAASSLGCGAGRALVIRASIVALHASVLA